MKSVSASGIGQRVPAEPVRVGLDLVERGGAQGAVADAGEPRVRRRRHDPVDPGPPVDRARLGERGPAELLGEQAERGALRRVAARGQRPGDGLAGELVPEPPLVRVLARVLAAGLLRAGVDVGHQIALVAPAAGRAETPLPPSDSGYTTCRHAKQAHADSARNRRQGMPCTRRGDGARPVNRDRQRGPSCGWNPLPSASGGCHGAAWSCPTSRRRAPPPGAVGRAPPATSDQACV